MFKKIIGPLQIMKSRVGLNWLNFILYYTWVTSLESMDLLWFFYGHLEEFLKKNVKKVYPRTACQHSRYLYDMTCRLQEIQCLDMWEEDQILSDDNHRSLSDTSMSDNTNNAINLSIKEYLNIDNNSYLCGSKFRIIQSYINNLWHTHKNHSQM